jgi:hypothetical protein
VIIIVAGNPVDGFEFYGPFESEEDAAAWAEHGQPGDWWIARVHTP